MERASEKWKKWTGMEARDARTTSLSKKARAAVSADRLDSRAARSHVSPVRERCCPVNRGRTAQRNETHMTAETGGPANERLSRAALTIT